MEKSVLGLDDRGTILCKEKAIRTPVTAGFGPHPTSYRKINGIFGPGIYGVRDAKWTTHPPTNIDVKNLDLNLYNPPPLPS
jgi:hypothetical protein